MYKEFNFTLYDNLWKCSSVFLKEDPKIGLTIKTYSLKQLHDNQLQLSPIEKHKYMNMIYEMKDLKIQFQSIDIKCGLKEYEDFIKKRLTFLEYQHMKGNNTNELSEMYIDLSMLYEPLKSFNGFNDNYIKLQCYCHSTAMDIATKVSRDSIKRLPSRKNSTPQNTKNEDIKGDSNPFANRINNNYINRNCNSNNTSNQNLDSFQRVIKRTPSQLNLKKQQTMITMRTNSNNLLSKGVDEKDCYSFKLKLDKNISNDRIPFVLQRNGMPNEPKNPFMSCSKDDKANKYSLPTSNTSKDQSITQSISGSISLPELSTDVSIISHSKIPSFSSAKTKSKDSAEGKEINRITPEIQKLLCLVKSYNSNAIIHLEHGFFALSIQSIKNSISALKDLQKDNLSK